MLVIFFSLFGAGSLHASRRASYSSSSASPSLARAPPGASRVSWRAAGALGPHLHDLLPHHAPWMSDDLPPPWGGELAVGDCLGVASNKHASPGARSQPQVRRASLQALTSTPPGLLVIPHDAVVDDDSSSRLATTTTYNYIGESLLSPRPRLAVRLLGLRASQPRCGVLEEGRLSYLPCVLDSPLLNVGVVYLSSYASTTSSMHTTTASITSSAGPAQSSRCGVSGLGGRLFGGWARVWSTCMGSLIASDLSLTPHHYSICTWAHPLHLPHWLAHFDYDLRFRLRVDYAFVPYHSKAMWSGLVSRSVRLWATFVHRTTLNLMCGLHAFSSFTAAFGDASTSSLPLLVALISSSNFIWHILGKEICLSLPCDSLNFISYCLWDGARPPLVRLPHMIAPLLFWSVIFSQVVGGSAVCLSCSGNDPNCKGGSTCVLAKALAANVLVMAGAVGAAKAITMGDDGKHILPLPWLQFLKPSVLQTLVSLANRAPSGTPLDLTSLTIQVLSAHISDGSVSISEGRLEFLRRMSADSVSDSDLLKMKTICEVLPQRGDERFQSPLSKLSNSGALQFVFALASQIVLKLSGAAKISVAIGESASSSSGLVSIELKRPQSSDAFFHSLTVWQTLLCATGLANVVVTGPFLSEVVHDVVPARGWKVALEHFLFWGGAQILRVEEQVRVYDQLAPLQQRGHNRTEPPPPLHTRIACPPPTTPPPTEHTPSISLG